MNPILIFRHVAYEGPGYLQDFLLQKNIPFELIRIDENEAVPGDLSKVSGLIFMGGYMSVNDPLPWIGEEIRLIQLALVKDIPVLGHCLGGQLIARAMGATISRNGVTEIGWHQTSKFDNVESRIWMAGLDNDMELFHWHSETFNLPVGAVPILTNRHCKNQGFVVGKTLALQCHIEMDSTLVKCWVQKNVKHLIPSDSIQSADEILQGLPTRIERLNSIADVLYSHWATGLPQY